MCGRAPPWRCPYETVMADVTGSEDPREIPRLRVPALRAKAKARDTPLGMTIQRPFALGEWMTSRQVSLPGTIYRAPTRRRRTVRSYLGAERGSIEAPRIRFVERSCMKATTCRFSRFQLGARLKSGAAEKRQLNPRGPEREVRARRRDGSCARRHSRRRLHSRRDCLP